MLILSRISKRLGEICERIEAGDRPLTQQSQLLYSSNFGDLLQKPGDRHQVCLTSLKA
ncbi:hypothetical protein [Thermoleptolyngbya sp. C42_A2020_037]|uniref:hypothetical protein n=1 Tax=Thermoleptolyngbya sp. C42_A2020_037 TaxID=2747799 RepID=UPI001A03093A|nr:hypothetical protein [Thermoleptolyngbya sp. C42_A2020_037]MBF2085047.1 hypothetical protein [Thermoleptolyngbya sp. C42_A2020_037]